MRMVQVCLVVPEQRVSPLLHTLQAVPAALQVWLGGQLLVSRTPMELQLRSVLPVQAAAAAQ
jgi:hypothetical protein